MAHCGGGWHGDVSGGLQPRLAGICTSGGGGGGGGGSGGGGAAAVVADRKRSDGGGRELSTCSSRSRPRETAVGGWPGFGGSRGGCSTHDANCGGGGSACGGGFFVGGGMAECTSMPRPWKARSRPASREVGGPREPMNIVLKSGGCGCARHGWPSARIGCVRGGGEEATDGEAVGRRPPARERPRRRVQFAIENRRTHGAVAGQSGLANYDNRSFAAPDDGFKNFWLCRLRLLRPIREAPRRRARRPRAPAHMIGHNPRLTPSTKLDHRRLPISVALIGPNGAPGESRPVLDLDAAGQPLLRAATPPAWSPFEMPQLEAIALKAIETREYHLSRLHALLLQGVDPTIGDPAEFALQLGALRAETADELYSLRLAGILVVEAVVRWRRRRRHGLEPFVWRSHNYLLKMLLDVFFLGLSENINETSRDPFLLTCFQTDKPKEEAQQQQGSPASQRAGSPSSPTSSSSPTMRRRKLTLAHLFTPGRRHTKHELVRMWAAERILEAERSFMGAGFKPIAPKLGENDYELRWNAQLVFYGQGETPELAALAPPLLPFGQGGPKRSKASQPPPPDPAQKPPPQQRHRDKNGVLQGPLAQRLNSRSMARKVGNNYYEQLAGKRALTRSNSVGGAQPSRHAQKELPGIQPQPIIPLVDPLSRPTTVPGSPLSKPSTAATGGLLTGTGRSPASQRAKTAPANEAEQAA